MNFFLSTALRRTSLCAARSLLAPHVPAQRDEDEESRELRCDLESLWRFKVGAEAKP